ncbi:MAG TPA: helix-hairpin-helix domain-containing protein [Terriglobales bacterium]|nr:helix-hairpin-helix domain-containing protein [Terriglobales bacterium]
MRVFLLGFILLNLLLLSACLSCSTNQNPDELRQRTAKTTAELKNDAKAVAQGVREGLSNGKTVDINSASQEQLSSLPGISDQRASRIIDNRPYDDPRQLVTRRILSQAEYDQIKNRVVAKK